MNKNILNTGVQNFIIKNINTDILAFLLKKPIFEGITNQELAQQIESKKKCQKKLPLWFETDGIYYPKKINIEQSSSETAALYKSKIVAGKSLADLTGGYGIDCFYFSEKMDSVYYCELDENLHKIAAHNYQVLGKKNVRTLNHNGLDFLQKSEMSFDWIYVDPSRRNKIKGKVFQLSDCEPDVAKNLQLLFSKSNNILIKTAPFLDISLGLKKLEGVKEIHIVAINNDVKELLWVLKKGFKGETGIKTINFGKKENQTFNFSYPIEKKVVSEYSTLLQYLYEPNSAILKSGAYKTIGMEFKLKKIHQHTHIYTSEKLMKFPGRGFRVLKTGLYTKKFMKTLNLKKANITTRNFPDRVSTIRKKFKIKDGGESYVFFFKNTDDILKVALCAKI